MKNLLLLAPIFVTWTVASAQSKMESGHDQALHLIEVWLDAQKDYDKLPGISAAIIKDQDNVWSGGFGFANPEQQVKTKAKTLGSICSISKLFTAVGIMKLYDDGKLRLDDEVQDLLPWYNLEQQFADSGPITVRSLLTHSSGLPREANAPYWTGPDFPFPSQEQIRSGLKEQKTLYPASTYFQYSNLGLTLLGEIIEEVSGTSYDEFIQDQILNPLALDQTRTTMPISLYGEQLAIGHSAVNRQGDRMKVNLFDGAGVTPAMGFSSSVEDLGKFASWQFRLLDTTVEEILKPATLRYMQQVHWTNPDWNTTWGLGFVVYKGSDNTKWVSHGGSCPGYRSVLMLNPKKKLAYAVMINSSGTDPGKYARGMHSIFKQAKDIEPDSNQMDIDLTEYAGEYDPSPWWSEEYLGILNNQLVVMNLPSDEPNLTFLKHVEQDTFRRVRNDKTLGETVTFERTSAGKINGYWQHGNFTRRVP